MTVTDEFIFAYKLLQSGSVVRLEMLFCRQTSKWLFEQLMPFYGLMEKVFSSTQL